MSLVLVGLAFTSLILVGQSSVMFPSMMSHLGLQGKLSL